MPAGALAIFVLALVACLPATPTERPVGREYAARFDRSNTPGLLATGERRIVSLTLTNIGSRTWQAAGPDPVRIGYRLRGPAGTADGEPAPLPADVPPGGTIDAVAAVVAPDAPGSYGLVWDLLRETSGWFEPDRGGQEVTIEVRAPEAKAGWESISVSPMHADVGATVEAKLKNTGTVTWQPGADGVRLAYHWRDGAGRLVVWDGVRTDLERPVLPGETLETRMVVLAPSATGRYVLELDLVREGAAWFGTTTSTIVDVHPPSHSYSMRLLSAPRRVVMGQPVDVKVSVTNTGSAPWANAGVQRVRLAYHVLTSDGNVLIHDGARTEIGRPVGPGESVELNANVRAPAAAGTYTFRFDLVHEGVAWLGERNQRVDVAVQVAAIDFAAHFYPVQVPVMATGQRYRLNVEVQNVGALPWPRAGFAPVRLAYHWLAQDGRTVVWDGKRAELPNDLGPGDRAQLVLEVTPPNRPEAYVLVVDMVQESVAWFASKVTLPWRADVIVAEPAFKASWIEHAIPEVMRAGTINRGRLVVRNDGPFPWVVTGDRPVRLAHHIRDAHGSLLVWDGFRTEFDRDVAPGETVALDVWFFAPATPGRYVLDFDVVEEDVTWFGWKGNPLLSRTIEVVP